MGSGTAGILAATTLVVTGCDTDEPLGLPGLPGRDEEPDLERVRTGLRDEQAVLDQLERVRRRHRTLRRPLAPTVDVHRVHVQLLGRAAEGDGEADDAGAPPEGARPRVPRDPVEALSQLVRLERSLAESHVETAMRSRSGVLARVVAAMSAAAAQQSVALTTLSQQAAQQAAQQGREQGGGG